MCTSVVAAAVDGTPLHARTMDFGMHDLLSPLTLILEFTRDGQIVYTAVSWAVRARRSCQCSGSTTLLRSTSSPQPSSPVL